MRVLVLLRSLLLLQGYIHSPHWCEPTLLGRLCSAEGCFVSEECKLLSDSSVVAVTLSNRLDVGTTSLADLCANLRLQTVVITAAGLVQPPGGCRLLVYRMGDVLDQLEAIGYQPGSVCNIPLNHSLYTATAIQPEHWDDSAMHCSCFNLVRFFLAELPVFAAVPKLLLVDDDVKLQHNSSARLVYPAAHEDAMMTVNCEVGYWNQSCHKFNYGRTSMGHLFSRMDLVPKLEQLFSYLDKHLDVGGAVARSGHGSAAWNFGVALLDVQRLRTTRLATRFQHAAQLVLRERIIPPTSLLYGLGLPFYLFEKRVACYPQYSVIDGLGFISTAEMKASGITQQVMKGAAALHYSGKNKQWIQEASSTSVQRLIPLVVFADARHGTEWLSAQLTRGQRVCGAKGFGAHLAPHSEALLPARVRCASVSSELPATQANSQVCSLIKKWTLRGPKKKLSFEELPPTSTCVVKETCSWRYVRAIATGQLRADEPWEAAWRAWWTQSKRLSLQKLFDKYLESLLTPSKQSGEKQDAQVLPLLCTCVPGSRFVVLKLFRGWFQLGPSTSAFQSLRYRFPREAGEYGSIDPITSLSRFQARFLLLRRDPLNVAISHIQAHATSQWHCNQNEGNSDNKWGACKSRPRVYMNPDGLRALVARQVRLMQEIDKVGNGASISKVDIRFNMSFEVCMQKHFVDCMKEMFKGMGLILQPDDDEVEGFSSLQAKVWDSVENADQVIGTLDLLQRSGIAYSSGLSRDDEKQRQRVIRNRPTWAHTMSHLARIINRGAFFRAIDLRRKIFLFNFHMCSGESMINYMRLLPGIRDCMNIAVDARGVKALPKPFMKWWHSSMPQCSFASVETLKSVETLSHQSSSKAHNAFKGQFLTISALLHLRSQGGHQPQVLMIFRDPVSRCKSHWSYKQETLCARRTAQCAAIHMNATMKSVQDVFVTKECTTHFLSMFVGRFKLNSGTTKHLSPDAVRTAPDAVSTAVRLVRAKVDFVGITEHFTASICTFLGQVGLFRRELCTCNTTQHSLLLDKLVPAPDAHDNQAVPLYATDHQLRQIASLDVSLYTEMVGIFLQRVKLVEEAAGVQLLCSYVKSRRVKQDVIASDAPGATNVAPLASANNDPMTSLALRNGFVALGATLGAKRDEAARHSFPSAAAHKHRTKIGRASL
eukprot:CAMPEP_0119301400 /NCGR_PEP_ID=MMETSP1333-20130426/3186_1 /TAXON_ID=418940 /ORGANISM="Scyphosphaera apsteinii, Strain RCC1455" /LENGTH=1164 /DNA_ID=CAMNT_0007303467 /DNA_START=31 /DNA_END=3525 /DNA_ORIENTATION=+